MKELIIGNLIIIGFIILLWSIGDIACEVSNTKITTDNAFVGFIGVFLLSSAGILLGKYCWGIIEGFLK